METEHHKCFNIMYSLSLYALCGVLGASGMDLCSSTGYAFHESIYTTF